MILPGTEPRVKLEVAALTDRGLRRAVNEDALFAADPCFIVADGMGGHDQGAAASRAAISAFSEAFTAPREATMQQIEAALGEAKRRVQAISERSERGAGCTLTGAIRIEHQGQPHWYVLNVGDSRVYLQRGGRLQQLTTDHSLQSELFAEGDSQAASTPRNIITRALGSTDDEHDAWLLPVEAGSRLLVCSDGLSSEISDVEIETVLAEGGDPAMLTAELVRRALAAGGRDNISVIVLEVVSGGVAAQASESVGEDAEWATLEITRPGSR